MSILKGLEVALNIVKWVGTRGEWFDKRRKRINEKKVNKAIDTHNSKFMRQLVRKAKRKREARRDST